MAHQEDWVRRFIVSEPKKHKKGFTLYKVTSVEFPKGSPQAGSTIVVWKRYNDFKKLHQELKLKHQQLYLKGTFPYFAKAKMFGRFDEAVIEERRKCALSLLEFIGEQGPLFNSDVCSKFLTTGYTVNDDNSATPTIPSHPLPEIYFPDAIGLLLPQSVTLPDSTINLSDTETNSLLGGTWQYPRVPDSISLSSVSSDEHTTFTDTDSSALSGVSTPLQNADLQFFDPIQQSPSKKPALSGSNSVNMLTSDTISNSWLLSTTPTCTQPGDDQPHTELLTEDSLLPPTLLLKSNANGSETDHTPSTAEAKSASTNNKIFEGCTELPAKTFITVRTEDFETLNLSKFHQASDNDETPEAALTRPFSPSDLDNESLNQNVNYIFEAAYHVGQAQLHEANGEFEAAFSFFKAGIACLLCGIQDETDARRKTVVSKKISKYLLHAEKLYNCHLGSQSTYHSRSSVPQLCRPLSELKCYRVLGIIEKQMLVLNTMDDICYVIKVLHKSSCPVNGHLKTIMPQNVPYMVAMHRYFETDSAVFIVLQHASGGRLWKHIGAYFQSVPNTPVRNLKQGNAYLGKKLIEGTKSVIRSSALPKDVTNGFLKASADENDVSASVSNDDTYLDLIRDYTDSTNSKPVNLLSDNQNMGYLQCKPSSEELDTSIISSNELHNGVNQSEHLDIPMTEVVDNQSLPRTQSLRSLEDKTDAHFGQNNNSTPDILSQSSNFIHEDSWKILNNLPTDDLVKNAQRLLESVSETLIQSESIANRLKDGELSCEELAVQDDYSVFGNFISESDVSFDFGSRVDHNFQPELKKDDDCEFESFLSNNETCGRETECAGGDVGSRRKKERKLSSRSQRSAKSSERRMFSSDELLGCARAPSGSLDREQQWGRLHLEDDRVKPRLPESTVRAWAAELLVCLDALHRWGVRCVDLRPDNILLGDQGHLLVTYMCQWESVDSLPNPNAIRRLYAAPEVNGIFPVSQAADWWSFGALIFELITGKSLSSCHPGGIHNHTFINIPDDVSENARSLLEELLKANPLERLGAGVNGAEDLKSHPFFNGVDWHAILDLGTNHLEE